MNINDLTVINRIDKKIVAKNFLDFNIYKLKFLSQVNLIIFYDARELANIYIKVSKHIINYVIRQVNKIYNYLVS